MTMGALALLVAFLSQARTSSSTPGASRFCRIDFQGPGAGAVQTGYRIAMLVSGAVALVIAERDGWFAAYSTMAALLAVGMLVFLFGPEPKLPPASPAAIPDRESLAPLVFSAVVGPFTDFMRRPLWPVILIFVVGYKVGEGMGAIDGQSSLHFAGLFAQ